MILCIFRQFLSKAFFSKVKIHLPVSVYGQVILFFTERFLPSYYVKVQDAMSKVWQGYSTITILEEHPNTQSLWSLLIL